ncbi:hypothetical protein N7490_006249 [Penicillium lividum]|nr:hypothetical protein N7490_006249 [Penicillium lividum]
MADSYFPLMTQNGTTCQVARSPETLNQPWESYLKILKETPGGLEGIDKASGISVRGWICDSEEDEVKVLLGQRAEKDSSPGQHEAFGGKCDPGESVLQALIREIFEETGLRFSCIHALLGVDFFLTPRSKRWVVQLHFLIEVEHCQKAGWSKDLEIQLDHNEHQSYIWVPGKLNPLKGLQPKEATEKNFASAVAAFREKCHAFEKRALLVI